MQQFPRAAAGSLELQAWRQRGDPHPVPAFPAWAERQPVAKCCAAKPTAPPNGHECTLHLG